MSIDSTPGALVTPIAEADLDEVLALNQANVPEVGSVDRARMARLVEMAGLAGQVRDGDGRLLGFVIVLPEDADYDSTNFAWFRRHRADHVYLDRIAVAEEARGRGIGRLLHEATIEYARAAGVGEVTLEVNVVPPNPRSMRFHRSLGFEQVGELAHSPDYVVAMLARPTAAAE